jgi:hypothetical protein
MKLLATVGKLGLLATFVLPFACGGGGASTPDGGGGKGGTNASAGSGGSGAAGTGAAGTTGAAGDGTAGTGMAGTGTSGAAGGAGTSGAAGASPDGGAAGTSPDGAAGASPDGAAGASPDGGAAILDPVTGTTTTGPGRTVAAVSTGNTGDTRSLGISYYVAGDNKLMAAGHIDGPYDLFATAKGGDGLTYNPEFVAIATSVVAVDASERTVLALRKDGTLWGAGDPKVFGLEPASSTKVTTAGFVKIASDVVSFTTMSRRLVLVKKDNSVWSLGVVGYLYFAVPEAQAVMPGLQQVATGYTAVSGGSEYLLLLKTTGSAMGVGKAAQLSLAADAKTPVELLAGVKKIAAVHDCSYFVKDDASVWVAGTNSCTGRKNTDPMAPVQAPNGAGVADVSGGPFADFWTLATGDVLAGNGTANFEDGRGADGIHVGLVKVLDGAVTAIAGRNHGIALKKDGTVLETGSYRSDGTGGPKAKFSNKFLQTASGALVP